MLFREEAARTGGILSIITREIALHDIVVSEFLTSSPELLMYVKDQYVAKAYEVVRHLPEIWGRRAGRGERSR